MAINKCDLTEMKSVSNPPQAVKNTWTAVLILLGYPQAQARDWSVAKKFLSQSNYALQTLKEHDASKVQPEQAAQAKAEMGDLSYESAMKICCALGSIYKWVDARLQ